MKKKFLSIILLAAMLISVILISPIYVSADTVTIGRDIDSWAQGYIDEVNTVKSDVNRNGTVDITDLVRLKKFLS